MDTGHSGSSGTRTYFAVWGALIVLTGVTSYNFV